MGGGFELGVNWQVMGTVADILTALALLSIFLAIVLVALRREIGKYRGALIFFAIFVLCAGVNQVLSLTGWTRAQSWWNLLTAILSVLAATIIVANLPHYLRMPKIAEELRGQAGFLEEQQALLQAIQDSVSDGIMLIDEDGQIRAFNAAALRILWGRDEQASKPLPEMKELAIRKLTQSQSDQDIVRWEGRLIERFTTNVPNYGKLYIFRDITMRRQLEEQRLRLERVITSMKEGFAIVSFETMRIVSTNPAMEQMLGYDKGELAGRDFSEIQAGNEEERRAVVETIARTVSRDSFWEGEVRNRRKDGGELIAHTTVSLMREGESQYFSCIQVDITEQKRLREDRQRLQVKLMETQRLESLARLAEGVGHEFNNLLTGIMGNAGLALDLLKPSDPIVGMVEDVMRASERAAAVSRQLLAFSGKTGRFVAHAADLSELISDLAGLAQASISKKVQFRMELDRNIPLVEADATQIRQAALNLIANGAEAIGDGSGTVTVSTGVDDLAPGAPRNVVGAEMIPPGRYVHIEVRDDGPGMNEETRSHIFDPFFTTKSAGRGLGLAAVLGIVRAHRGAIEVSSAPGQGSVFRLLFPAAEARLPRTSPPRLPEPVRGKVTILVVEDEPIVRRTTLAALSQYGFEVRAAENGQIAVEMFQEMADQISLVLLDVVMPVMGGEEALALIKKIRPDVPVVICSGHNEVETMERFNQADVDGIVKKPYTAKQLVDQLKAVLENRGITESARRAT
jgi:PAS domain S-box-containing protein